MAPCVRGGVSLRRKSGVPVVLEEVNFAPGACCTRSTDGSQRASAIDCDCCAEEVAGVEGGGRGEDLRAMSGDVGCRVVFY